MTRTVDPSRLRRRDRMAFVAAAICAVTGILIWTLWVLPIVRSIDAAEDVPIGETMAVELDAGSRVGIWTMVECRDSLDTYDGRFLVAGDSIGDGSTGLGRTGGNDFAVGTLLALGAVMCPPLAVLLPLVILLRRLITRRAPRATLT